MLEPKNITAWGDLAALLEQCSDAKWIFRGEHRIFESLRPKAGRITSVQGADLLGRSPTTKTTNARH